MRSEHDISIASYVAETELLTEVRCILYSALVYTTSIQWACH